VIRDAGEPGLRNRIHPPHANDVGVGMSSA